MGKKNKKKGKRKRFNPDSDDGEFNALDDSGSGRNEKHYFQLLVQGSPTKKTYSSSGGGVEEMAFTAAKKAWRDNKLLNIITMRDVGSGETFSFDPRMWTAKNSRKFRTN